MKSIIEFMHESENIEESVIGAAQQLKHSLGKKGSILKKDYKTLGEKGSALKDYYKKLGKNFLYDLKNTDYGTSRKDRNKNRAVRQIEKKITDPENKPSKGILKANDLMKYNKVDKDVLFRNKNRKEFGNLMRSGMSTDTVRSITDHRKGLQQHIENPTERKLLKKDQEVHDNRYKADKEWHNSDQVKELKDYEKANVPKEDSGESRREYLNKVSNWRKTDPELNRISDRNDKHYKEVVDPEARAQREASNKVGEQQEKRSKLKSKWLKKNTEKALWNSNIEDSSFFRDRIIL